VIEPSHRSTANQWVSLRLAGEQETIGLAQLGGLSWNGFPRSDPPSWHDHVSATLKAHEIRLSMSDPDDHRPVTREVKLAAVGDGTRFALAAPGIPLPAGLRWHRLAGRPLVRRTWAVWPAASRSAALAAVVAAPELRLSDLPCLTDEIGRSDGKGGAYLRGDRAHRR
jgi:hypothetical protein